MSKFYPEPYEPFGRDINVTVDLSNYGTKTDLKKVTYVDTSSNELTNHNHDKYIDTQEYNKLAADVFNVRIAQAKLIAKT